MPRTPTSGGSPRPSVVSAAPHEQTLHSRRERSLALIAGSPENALKQNPATFVRPSSVKDTRRTPCPDLRPCDVPLCSIAVGKNDDSLWYVGDSQKGAGAKQWKLLPSEVLAPGVGLEECYEMAWGEVQRDRAAAAEAGGAPEALLTPEQDRAALQAVLARTVCASHPRGELPSVAQDRAKFARIRAQRKAEGRRADGRARPEHSLGAPRRANGTIVRSGDAARAAVGAAVRKEARRVTRQLTQARLGKLRQQLLNNSGSAAADNAAERVVTQQLTAAENPGKKLDPNCRIPAADIHTEPARVAKQLKTADKQKSAEKTSSPRGRKAPLGANGKQAQTEAKKTGVKGLSNPSKGKKKSPTTASVSTTASGMGRFATAVASQLEAQLSATSSTPPEPQGQRFSPAEMQKHGLTVADLLAAGYENVQVLGDNSVVVY